jgi:hypothetical protein
MLLEQGNKLLVTHRRLFEGDLPRFFVGEVEAYEDEIRERGDESRRTAPSRYDLSACSGKLTCGEILDIIPAVIEIPRTARL